MKWPITLLHLLERLARALEGWVRRQRQEERQDDRDKLEKDPAEWYGDHFGGGVHKHRVKPGEADEADDNTPDR